MKISYIRPAKDKGYLRLGVSDGENESREYTLSESEYHSLGEPFVGDNLTRDTLSLFSRADMRYRGRKKALNILSYSDNSTRSLAKKLIAAGIRGEVAREIVHEMVSLGYIDEERQLRSFIINEASRKHHGPRRIYINLASKRYHPEKIRRVMAELVDSGEIDFEKEKRLLIESVGSALTQEEIKKLLYKNGYL